MMKLYFSVILPVTDLTLHCISHQYWLTLTLYYDLLSKTNGFESQTRIELGSLFPFCNALEIAIHTYISYLLSLMRHSLNRFLVRIVAEFSQENSCFDSEGDFDS